MRNKIILLLVLLIPSLCFGKSLKITAQHHLHKKFQIDIMDSSELPNVMYSFSTKKDYIDLSKEDNFKHFRNLMMLHFPKDCLETFNRYNISEDKPFFYLLFQNCIMDLAILNNYQVTFTETELNDSGYYIFTVFLYKQDK